MEQLLNWITGVINAFVVLTHFKPILNFCITGKYQKTLMV